MCSTRKRDETWDAMAALFFPNGVPDLCRSRFAKCVKAMKQQGANPNDFRSVYERILKAWDGKRFSPEKFATYYQQYAGGPGGTNQGARVRSGDPSKYAGLGVKANAEASQPSVRHNPPRDAAGRETGWF